MSEENAPSEKKEGGGVEESPPEINIAQPNEHRRPQNLGHTKSSRKKTPRT